jgi:hypothetical protein
VLQAFHALGGERAFDAHEIFLLDRGVLADQLFRDAAILRQHQQPRRVDVESPGGNQRLKMLAPELDGRRVRGPAVLRPDQYDRGFVTIFRLTGDVAHGLVQQDGDLFALVLARGGVYLDTGIGRYARAQGVDDHPIHRDPTTGDPALGFASGAQAQFAHALGEARVV